MAFFSKIFSLKPISFLLHNAEKTYERMDQTEAIPRQDDLEKRVEPELPAELEEIAREFNQTPIQPV